MGLVLFAEPTVRTDFPFQSLNNAHPPIPPIPCLHLISKPSLPYLAPRALAVKFNFVEYPPESKKLPSGTEIVKMMEEREAKRRSAAARSGIDAHLAAAGAGAAVGTVAVKRVRKLPIKVDWMNVPHVAGRSALPGPPPLFAPSTLPSASTVPRT